MFCVWGHSTYEKKDDKELMQPQEQPIRRTAAQEKRKKICMYCIKINRERRHWKSYAHKPGHVQNDSGSKKQKKKKKNPTSSRTLEFMRVYIISISIWQICWFLQIPVPICFVLIPYAVFYLICLAKTKFNKPRVSRRNYNLRFAPSLQMAS